MLLTGLVSSATAQSPTVADVEQRVRAEFAAWNTQDTTAIVEMGLGGTGFGYRTRAGRGVPGTKAAAMAGVRAFFAAVEYFRVSLDELHASVEGDIGIARGFYTEEFQMRGRAPEVVRARFSVAMRRAGDEWRTLLYHRDAQPFDEQGWYIPAPTARP
jgi:ketosteroid isomerase-like protein